MKTVIGLILFVMITASSCSSYTCATYVKHTPKTNTTTKEVKI
jgi:PBP1b-binding outer membrane lipoprotein LpoB